MDEEWARAPADVLWRRSKLGLRLDAARPGGRIWTAHHGRRAGGRRAEGGAHDVALEGWSGKWRGGQPSRDVSLTLRAGSLNVLLGPTLAGKTSLMRLMAGLDPPTPGRLLVDGRDVTGARRPQAQRRHGLPAVHQLPGLDRLREHRLAAAGRRAAARRRSSARVREAARAAEARALSGRASRSSCPAASSSAPRSRARW